MSDPMSPERRHARDPDLRPDARTDSEVPPRRGGGASMVLWILLLLAIIATAWYFLGRDDAEMVPEPTPIGETVPEPSRSPVSTAPAPRESTPERARPAQIDRDARPLTQTPPEYPATALRSGIEGTVLVLVEVGADGVPTEVSVARRSSSRDLDRAALQAVRGWRFEPAMRNGKAVASSVQVPVDFQLDTR